MAIQIVFSDCAFDLRTSEQSAVGWITINGATVKADNALTLFTHTHSGLAIENCNLNETGQKEREREKNNTFKNGNGQARGSWERWCEAIHDTKVGRVQFVFEHDVDLILASRFTLEIQNDVT